MDHTCLIRDAVGETLLMTLYMRSVESAKDDPMINDPTAERLVDSLDYDFSKFQDSNFTRIGCNIRALYFDQLTRTFIQNNEHPLVILMGTGLDSRVERIGAIADKAQFLHVDIDEVIKLREGLIPPRPNEIYMASSILHQVWIDLIQTRFPNREILIVIEGVVMYFERCEVRRVFRNIAKRLPGSEIVHDEVSTFIANYDTFHNIIKYSSSLFRSGCDDSYEMQSWAPNLKLVAESFYRDWPEAKRTGIQGTLMSHIPALNKAARMLHYKTTANA